MNTPFASSLFRRGYRGLACLALAGATLLAPGTTGNPAFRHVVLITLDTTRADHLGAYGYSRPTSPFIDDLARTGLRFTNHFTPMPTTEPAHATMLTGLYPRSHGILANGTRAALPNLPTLGTWFQRRGYRTAALLSRYGLAPEKLGLAGFDEQWEPGAVPAESAAPATYGRFREFLRANESRPFFLWLHFFDPHDPYRPPGTFDVFAPGNREPEAPHGYVDTPISGKAIERTIALYDGEIRTVDHYVGLVAKDLMDARKPGDPPPLIVLTADHGEEMDELIDRERFVFNHGKYLFVEQLHVPLIFWSPGRVTPGLETGLHDHAGLARMITRLVSGERDWVAPPAPYLVAERRLFVKTPPRPFLLGDDFSVITAGEQAVFYGKRPPELYRRDGNGARPETGGEAEGRRLKVLAGFLAEWQLRTPKTSRSAQPADDERMRVLRSLGYLQ